MLIEAWKPIWGGGQAHVWELANALVKNHECKVDIFVMDIKGSDEKKYQEYFNGKLRIFRVGNKTRFNFIDRINWCYKIKKLIQLEHKKETYNLIHAHANLPGWPAKKIGKKLNLPIVYTVHGCGVKSIKDMYKNPIISTVLYWFENYLQTKIKYDYEITVDKSFLEYKNKNKQLSIIPNGASVEKFDKIKSSKSKNFKIIFVGRLHPQKGLSYLIKATNLIRKELGNSEIHLVGGGPEEKELKELTSKLKLHNIIKFRGKIYGDDLVKEYKSANLFVLPSLYEGQPLTLLEAWGAKLPVIVTNVGGNEDFIEEGKNGYMIDAKNIKTLSETLIKAKKNKNLAKMGLEGYKLVKEKYSWNQTAKKTFKIYNKVLKNEK